ncbi:hypothetical protein H8356DRAFT_1434882 [Neocallimastix lanati (nom. inval.)]|nr:hypothetical protein H8356DRAFT_1434882 [Neocallimastix sp. JGI-2020a]
MLTFEELDALQATRSYFIEDRTDASVIDWIRSKGTNFTCYINYLNSLDNEKELNNKIDVIRTIIYAFNKPLQFTFFYWTLLLFILHKFNFKKPLMKIILVHFILRSIGDILNKLGDLMPNYYATTKTVTSTNETIYGCQFNSPSPEMHPLKWVLTRQIGCIFWCTGEIVADWYPLLRTKAVCDDKKSIRTIYVTCGIFNFFKILLIIYHFTLSPSKLYTDEGVYDKKAIDMFYFKYWVIQLSIIYASAIYDASVYFVLKRYFDKMNNYSEFGFIAKFKAISEYRILISAVVCAIFLPIISLTILMKFYYYIRYDYHNLEFSFDEIRQTINNVQYFMIFIDQILLINSRNETALEISRPKSIMLSPGNSNNDIYKSNSITSNNIISSSNAYNSNNIMSSTNTISNDNIISSANAINSNNNTNYYKNKYSTNNTSMSNPGVLLKNNTCNYLYSNSYSNQNLRRSNSNYLFNYTKSSTEPIIKIGNTNNDEKVKNIGHSRSVYN